MLSYHPENISTLQNDLDKEEGEKGKKVKSRPVGAKTKKEIMRP